MKTYIRIIRVFKGWVMWKKKPLFHINYKTTHMSNQILYKASTTPITWVDLVNFKKTAKKEARYILVLDADAEGDLNFFAGGKGLQTLFDKGCTTSACNALVAVKDFLKLHVQLNLFCKYLFENRLNIFKKTYVAGSNFNKKYPS